MKREFHGRGASFHRSTGPAGEIRQSLSIGSAGGIRENAAAGKIEESIRIILGTQYGERVMRPGFGCNLKSLVFAPNNEATGDLARHYVEEGLRRWEPRIELLNVFVQNDNRAGILIINVHYRIRATQEERSLVYPFYLEQP